MKLLVQPGDGVQPLVRAINQAKKSVEIAIFRFDRGEVEKALAAAVTRGVFVHALIAYTNRGGEKNLRKLEMRLLAAGVTVARTADDLARYHGKYMIIDRRELWLLAFNYTYLDIEHSRSFGVVTAHSKMVDEAAKLFEADAKRQAYAPSVPDFVVSPANSRKQLSAFIKGAKKRLLIYDPEISDAAMIRLLEERAKAGVEIKIIGRLTQKTTKLSAKKLAKVRLHTRTILRDGRQAFIGSQSLREVELGSRREVGIIFRDAKIVSRLIKIFQEDLEAEGAAPASIPDDSKPDPKPVTKVAKKVAKMIAKDLSPATPVLEVAMKEFVESGIDMDSRDLEATVKEAVKEAVKDAVRDVVEEAVALNGASTKGPEAA